MPASSTPDGLAYAAVVESTIAKGRIARIDTSAARRVAGVLDVLTHENRPRMADTDKAWKDDVAPEEGSPFRPLYDDRIMFSGQPIALVLAEDWETARYAASLVEIEYDKQAFVTDLHTQRDQAFVGQEAREAARRRRQGLCSGRGAPRGRIFHPDRASQPDGIVCLHRDVGRRRQADGL